MEEWIDTYIDVTERESNKDRLKIQIRENRMKYADR